MGKNGTSAGKWIKDNLLTILLTALMATCAGIGTLYFQGLKRCEADVIGNEKRIRTLEGDFGVMDSDMNHIRGLMDERATNMLAEMERISNNLIDRMDQQKQFLETLIKR